jgi:uncharacterized protein (DUF1330 family)
MGWAKVSTYNQHTANQEIKTYSCSYVFGTIGEITDTESYKAYIARNVDILSPYNAKFLVRFGKRWLPEREHCTPPEPARFVMPCTGKPYGGAWTWAS